MKNRDELLRLFDSLVPASGQAETTQGELVRCVVRLKSEATRNGNINWDDGFRKMHAYLRAHLLDGTFAKDEATKIKADLARTRSGRNPCLDDEVWWRLGDWAVEWVQAHPEPVPHQADPDLRR